MISALLVLICQWVRLAVEEINACHTQTDVQAVLEQLPKGMEALYCRMATTVTQRASSADRMLAATILHFVSCSFKALNIGELSFAVDKDTTQMLDFQHSVIDLCSGFVLVDNDGNVSLIHQTAREYLLSASESLRIDGPDAHRRLFLSCMRRLMIVGLRAKIKGSTLPEFLEYAACYWSVHLNYCPADDEEVFETLKRFLSGNWILVWIQILATNSLLRVMVQASKNLSKYLAQRKSYEQSQPEQNFQIMAKELLESWSQDMTKIVGKFGAILSRDPESIYKLIPPFCPANSAIYQQFGKGKDKSLTISGFSTGNWDDSLARLSFELGAYAASIKAAGSLVATRFSAGKVTLHNAASFEETKSSPLKHGERIYVMQLSSDGTILATYGYQTVKVWETSNGRCRMAIKIPEKRPRPLTMLVTQDNSSLLIGADDRRIRSLDLNHNCPAWQLKSEFEEPELEGHIVNSANHMALNKDGTLAAVAYRGYPLSAWEIEGPIHIGHCWRKREEIARGEVIEAIWHPHSAELIGLYIEGVIFKWCPYDDEVYELATGAARLALTGDGNLLATGDVRGTVKVFMTSTFSALYQLTSEDMVLGLAFSPDLRRFYDIRGNYGNVWEPNALLRFSELQGGDTEISSDLASEIRSFGQDSASAVGRFERIDAITAIAVSPLGRLYCYGTQRGTIRLHDVRLDQLQILQTLKGFLTISQISWSPDGKMLCFTDSSRKLYVLSITMQEHSVPNAEKIAEIDLGDELQGPAIQLFFNASSDRIMAFSLTRGLALSMPSLAIDAKLEFRDSSYRWLTHPQDKSLLLGVSPGTVLLMDSNFIEHQRYDFEQSKSFPVPSDSEENPVIERVFATQDNQRVLVQIRSGLSHSKEMALFYFDTPVCPETLVTKAQSPRASEKPKATITLAHVSHDIISEINFILGFGFQDSLIYLSRTFSICSWRLPPRHYPLTPSESSSTTFGENAATRDLASKLANRQNAQSAEARNGPKVHFSLPGDWISRDCLALSCFWKTERSFVCPRNGEVAVVRCSALV